MAVLIDFLLAQLQNLIYHENCLLLYMHCPIKPNSDILTSATVLSGDGNLVIY